MKFESMNLIQIEGYSKSRQGFVLEDFPNLRTCKPFQDRKVKFCRRIKIHIFGFKPKIF
jgi:hypothetical protein